MNLELVHIILSVGVLAVSAFVGYMTLLIKSNQSIVKEDLVKNQTAIREDLNAKHAENTRVIATHAAEDTVQFASISRTLHRIDARADEQTRKQDSTALTLARIEGKLDRNGH